MAEQYAREPQLVAELRAKITQVDGTRALAAFNRVLQAAGVDAWTASDAQFKLDAWSAGLALDNENPALEGAAEAWRNAIEAARVELRDKAPFVSSAAFGLVDFLGGLDRGELPTIPMIRRVG